MAQPICSNPETSKIKVKICPNYSTDQTACYPIEGQFIHLILSKRHPNHISSDCHIEYCSSSVVATTDHYAIITMIRREMSKYRCNHDTLQTSSFVDVEFTPLSRHVHHSV